MFSRLFSSTTGRNQSNSPQSGTSQSSKTANSEFEAVTDNSTSLQTSRWTSEGMAAHEAEERLEQQRRLARMRTETDDKISRIFREQYGIYAERCADGYTEMCTDLKNEPAINLQQQDFATAYLAFEITSIPNTVRSETFVPSENQKTPVSSAIAAVKRHLRNGYAAGAESDLDSALSSQNITHSILDKHIEKGLSQCPHFSTAYAATSGYSSERGNHQEATQKPKEANSTVSTVAHPSCSRSGRTESATSVTGSDQTTSAAPPPSPSSSPISHSSQAHPPLTSFTGSSTGCRLGYALCAATAVSVTAYGAYRWWKD